MRHTDQDLVQKLTGELTNFEDIARGLIPRPGDVPALQGIDVFGGTLPLNGVVGGDHLIYVDFKKRFDLAARIQQALDEERLDVVEKLKRCQRTAGIALLDVSGHRVTDACMAAMLHQAFLVGAMYELDMAGHVTRRLFENLNARFHQSSSAHKFISMIYGEVSEDGRFNFLSAAQPFPLVFSNEHNRFMEVSKDLCVSFPPLGMLPSLHVIDRQHTWSPLGFKDRYHMNKWVIMGDGDILLLHTDGVSEHSNAAGHLYVEARLEQTLQEIKHQSAAEIFDSIISDMKAFGDQSDDISLVVIKRATSL